MKSIVTTTAMFLLLSATSAMASGWVDESIRMSATVSGPSVVSHMAGSKLEQQRYEPGSHIYVAPRVSELAAEVANWEMRKRIHDTSSYHPKPAQVMLEPVSKIPSDHTESRARSLGLVSDLHFEESPTVTELMGSEKHHSNHHHHHSDHIHHYTHHHTLESRETIPTLPEVQMSPAALSLPPMWWR